MKVSERQNGNVTVFELAGELDFHTSPVLREKLQKVSETQGHKIVVNLKAVSYIDSSGLATFVEAFQKAKRFDGRLVLAELVSTVRSVFEIAKLDKVFTLAGSEADAITVACL